ncbi:MAG TPA: hypothetical protein VMF90_26020, partial [Rhizobiaceae bacterium]|nr:hypothetical protein [Rhizobiaceae bacterium]
WQLGLKAGLVMLSCRQGWSDTSLASQMPLVAIKMTSTGASYHPLLDNCPIPPDRLKFSKWWEQPVLRDSEHRTISRKNLIFSLRNQDGGAHVDGELSDHAYTAISRENGAGWLFGRPGGPGTPLDPGPHLATMRQIGWEVQQSLTPVDEEN